MLSVEQVSSCGIVPVVVLNDEAQAVPTAKALLKGGITAMEITFRTDAAAGSIARVAKEVPEMVVGAGTVINIEQLHQAVDAGARFIVSHGFDPELVTEAAKLCVPIVPGAITPSEIMQGLKLGIRIFKFFPAEASGGMKVIKALCGPFPQIRFIPTGGISEKNAAEYLSFSKIQAVGGSWMVSKDMIAAGDYEGIAAKSAEAVKLYKEAKAK